MHIFLLLDTLLSINSYHYFSSQCMVSGSQNGIVRLWTLSLQKPITTPVTAGSTFAYGVSQLRGTNTQIKEEKKQMPIAEFKEMQSPVLCVTLTVSPSGIDISGSSTGSSSSSSYSSRIYSSNNNSSMNSSSSGSASRSNSSSMMIAAGSLDGTVAVWAASPSSSSQSDEVDITSDSNNNINTHSHRLLFCHQLRPSER